ALLSTPVKGWINLHFSLLPQWRGAAPVQRALIAGDAQLGASVFQLVPALDAGDVFATRVVDVAAGATADAALETLAIDGAQLTSEVVEA
ncbi:methionyl-tRNA formyltransferase, partial [Mycobacterium tuberculosis]|nr:methionyl-tRNA formyltransferase [Mycobacterium tuberculosis]